MLSRIIRTAEFHFWVGAAVFAVVAGIFAVNYHPPRPSTDFVAYADTLG